MAFILISALIKSALTPWKAEVLALGRRSIYTPGAAIPLGNLVHQTVGDKFAFIWNPILSQKNSPWCVRLGSLGVEK